MTALQKARAAYHRLDGDAQKKAETYFDLVRQADVIKAKYAGNRLMNVINTRLTQIFGGCSTDQERNIISKIRAGVAEGENVFQEHITKIKKTIDIQEAE